MWPWLQWSTADRIQYDTNSCQVCKLSRTDMKDGYCNPLKSRKRHIQPTPTILPPIDVETNRLWEGAEADLEECRTIEFIDLQKYPNLQDKRAAVRPKRSRYNPRKYYQHFKQRVGLSDLISNFTVTTDLSWRIEPTAGWNLEHSQREEGRDQK